MGTLIKLFGIIPAIITAIKAIEEALPIAGQGKAKLDAVLELITAADASLKEHLPTLAMFVGTLVKLFNASGLFGSKTAA